MQAMRRIEGRILKKYKPRAYDLSTYQWNEAFKRAAIVTVVVNGNRASLGYSWDHFSQGEPTDFISTHRGIDHYTAEATLTRDGAYWSSDYTEHDRPFLADVLETFPQVPTGFDGWFTAY